MIMTSAEVRQAFLEFFKRKGHAVVSSSSLVPDDPTLLFTNAGMVQFKDAFLGLEKRSYNRATTSQKCMRVSGKHNDLETVGPSPRHHTFFEMLGNFSFGEGAYFKREAIEYAWEFITQVMALNPDRLQFTVYQEDDEAYGYWRDLIGVPPERIHRMGEKTNFWMMGDTGPCGPTSEIHYDFGPEYCNCGDPNCSVPLDNGCGRWLELWNLVFMQFDQSADGKRTRLPRPGVDTGMGLERIVAVKQGVYSNYETDLFTPIMARTRQLLGHQSADMEQHLVAYRVIADHGRAMTFLIADGVLPGNEGRSYVLRLIMRRAMRFGKLAGFTGPFLGEIARTVIEVMGGHYRGLVERKDFILQAIRAEEERFQRTLNTGVAILDTLIADLKARGAKTIPGHEVFRLYDTSGFPPDLTRVIAEENGLTIDRAGFEAAMAEQRARARAAKRFGVEETAERYRHLNLPPTRFVGYETMVTEGTILMLTGRPAGMAVQPPSQHEDFRPIERAGEGDEIEIVLDQTPFYAEAGGQVGDTGRLISPTGTVQIEDTHSPVPGLVVHDGRVTVGFVARGQQVRAEVDADRRWDIMRNHTATHLLHKALQSVLGAHALQKGSLVAPDRLRFDFQHLSAVSAAELAEIERRVNAQIRADLPVVAQQMTYDEALKAGATALFGEKYGDVVRMISVDDYSRELCGGTHLRSTGQIGFFQIVSESSIAQGVRRIEAMTGRGAEEYVRHRLGLLEAIASEVQAPAVEAPHKVALLLAELQTQRREIARLRRVVGLQQVTALAGQVKMVEGVPVLAARVDAVDLDGLREMTDWLRDRVKSAVIVLGTVVDGKPQLVASVTEDLVARGLHAGKLINRVAEVVGGRGGGRPQMAQAGGRDPEKLGEALEQVTQFVLE